MSEKCNALLVFCEGDHDIAYIRIILRKILRFERLKLTFSHKSLSVVLKESGLITEDALKASANVKDFTNFLTRIIGQNSHAES